jgi:uncharacterized RDD family membrane protein YckC
LAFAVDAAVPVGGIVAMYGAGWLSGPPWFDDPTLPWFEQVAVTFRYGWSRYWQVLVLAHLPWALWMAAFGVFERETPGFRVARMRLVDRMGSPAGGSRRLLRAAAHLVWPLSLYALAPWVWVSRSRRSAMDVVSGTYPIRVRHRATPRSRSV